MASYLEAIPRDILQHIAFLSGSASVMEAPVDVPNLLRTSSTIYRSLNMHVSPDLYSHIFSTKFDIRAAQRRYCERLPDSALAAELMNRCKLLQRSYRVDLSSDTLIQDLWTALWMLLENDSLNVQQLHHANFSYFLLSLARVRLAATEVDVEAEADTRIVKYIIVWLLCLSLPRSTILDMPKDDRDDLYALIFPYIFLDDLDETLVPFALSESSHENQGSSAKITASGHDRVKVKTYLKEQNLIVSDPSIAAINLAFVLFEASTLKIPYHLPETRASAQATMRSGPTQEDYKILARYQTPLLADLQGSDRPSSMSRSPTPNEQEQSTHTGFGNILRSVCDGARAEIFSYIPGTLSGLWEGVFRTVESPIRNLVSAPIYESPLMSMVMIKPMQCHLVEYSCQSPTFEVHDLLDLDILDADVRLPDHFEGLSVKDEKEFFFKGHKYIKCIPRIGATSPDSAAGAVALVLGQTLEDHDQAWGGFNFMGRIREDGHVLLKRAPKYSDGLQGVCIFEGQLRYDSLILGRWRLPGNSSFAHHGIFSLGKSRESLAKSVLYPI